MKKILLLIIPIFLMLNCEIKIDTKSVNAQKSEKILSSGGHTTKVSSYEKDGIEYLVFEVSTSSASGGRDVFVVNHTKELLEVELLRKKLNK